MVEIVRVYVLLLGAGLATASAFTHMSLSGRVIGRSAAMNVAAAPPHQATDYLSSLTLKRGPTAPHGAVSTPSSYANREAHTPALRESEVVPQRMQVVPIARSAQIVIMTFLLLVARLPAVLHAATQMPAFQRKLHDVNCALQMAVGVLASVYVAVLHAVTEASLNAVKNVHGLITSPRATTAEYLATLSAAPNKKWTAPVGYTPANKVWTSPFPAKSWSAPINLAYVSTKLESRAEAMTMGASSKTVNRVPSQTPMNSSPLGSQPPSLAPERKWKKPEGYVPTSRSSGNLV